MDERIIVWFCPWFSIRLGKSVLYVRWLYNVVIQFHNNFRPVKWLRFIICQYCWGRVESRSINKLLLMKKFMARLPQKFRYWNKRIFAWNHTTKSGKSPLDEIIPNSTILTIELRCIFLFKFRNSNLCSNRSNAGNFQSAAHPVFHLICLHFLYFLQ